MKRFIRSASVFWGIFVFCLFAACMELSAATVNLKSSDSHHGITVTFNEDKTITVTGVSPRNAGGKIHVFFQSYGYPAQYLGEMYASVDAGGNVYGVSAPLNANAVSVFVEADPEATYVYMLKGPWFEIEPWDEPVVTELAPDDPALKKTVPPDTIPAIIAKWEQYKPRFDYSQTLYDTEPLLSVPYKAGKLKEQVLIDALNMTKFSRYLAGMSEGIRLSERLNETAGHKTVVLEKSYDPADPHHPKKPADMDSAFFNTAEGWRSLPGRGFENLHYKMTPKDAVVSFMNDRGQKNMYSVGHRRAILYPDLQEVGFGYTDNYTIMHMFGSGTSRSWPADRDYVAWPAPGNFPTLFADLQMYSLMLNPNKYAPVDPNRLRIEVLSKRQAKKWLLYSTDFHYSDAGNMFIGANDAWGQSSPYITFGPHDLRIQDGDEVTVRVTGLRDLQGNEKVIEYTTHYFALEGRLKIEPESVRLKVGETFQLTVLVEDAQGLVRDVTREATYRPLDAASGNYFSIDPAGKITALKANVTRSYPVEISYGSLKQRISVMVSEAIPFTDVDGHWAYEAIEWGVNWRLIGGYEDGTFRPDQPVSEAEFLAFFYRPRVDPALIGNSFDSSGYSHWAEKIYWFADLYNVPVLGIENEEARDQPITRTRVAEIIAAADGVNYTGDDAIRYVLGKGYSAGKTSATIAGYAGDDWLTRAEALQFSHKLMDRIKLVKKRPLEPSPASELPPLP
jgi:hypothetical protein